MSAITIPESKQIVSKSDINDVILSKSTPVGMTVTCESELTAVEGRKLVFKVSLYDEKGPVGGGVHERFVVNDAKFAAKAESKKG